MEDIAKLEDELQSLGGIVTYQKDRQPTVTINIKELNNLINQARINGLEIIDKLDDPYEIPDEYTALKVIQKYTKNRIKELKEISNG